MRKLFANLYLALSIGLYSGSLYGVLFLSDSAVILGFFAFVLMVILGLIQQGFQRRPFILKKLWKFVFPCFIALFIALALLSGFRGAPKLEDRPVFAKRDHYYFTRGEKVSRWRFLAVGTCFYLAWHLFAMAASAEQWAAWRAAHKPIRKSNS